MREAPLEEPREFGGETEVEAGIAQRQGGPWDMLLLQFLEMSVEFDPKVEDEDSEEGNWADGAFATDEAGLMDELFDGLGTKEAVSASSTSPGRSGT